MILIKSSNRKWIQVSGFDLNQMYNQKVVIRIMGSNFEKTCQNEIFQIKFIFNANEK